MSYIENPGSNYDELIWYLTTNYDEVEGEDFYRYIFPNNQKTGEYNTDKNHWKANAVYLYHDEDNSEKTYRRRIMLDDTWEEDFENYIYDNHHTLCSGLSYRGKANTLLNARELNAIIIDLDSVSLNELKNLIDSFDNISGYFGAIPRPTFLVTSGTGIHIYYVLDQPVDLFPYLKQQFKELKYGLTYKAWNPTITSKDEVVQYQSIAQGFRMVGSINPKYGENLHVRAFQVGDRVSVDYLNSYVKEEQRVDLDKLFTPSKMTLEEARLQYPDWFERRILKGENLPKRWQINRAVYDWWKKQSLDIVGGHRYWYLYLLGVYAVKCGISKEEFSEDCWGKYPELKRKPNGTDIFKPEDVESAIESYDPCNFMYSIIEIERKSGLRIERNRRNYRKQKEHIKFMNAVRDNVSYPEGGWQNKQGAPTKEKEVRVFIKEASKKNSVSEIAKDLGVTRATVYKYINSEEVKNDRGSNKEDLVISYIKKYPKKNVSEIAKQLGISRTTVYKYKKKYGL